jgi:hypothetical protein
MAVERNLSLDHHHVFLPFFSSAGSRMIDIMPAVKKEGIRRDESREKARLLEKDI